MVCLMVLNILCLFAFLFGRWYFWCLHVTIFTAKFQFQSSNWCLGTYSSPFEEGLSTSASCAGLNLLACLMDLPTMYLHCNGNYWRGVEYSKLMWILT